MLFKALGTYLSVEKDGDIVDHYFSPKNPECLKSLLSFAINEFSPENILCYLAVIDYRRFPSDKKLDFIMAQFIANGAPSEINFPSSTVTLIRDQFTNYQRQKRYQRNIASRSARYSAPDAPPPANIFFNANVELELAKNITDTLSRFQLQYQKHERFVGDFVRHVEIKEPSQANSVRMILNAMRTVGFHIPGKLVI